MVDVQLSHLEKQLALQAASKEGKPRVWIELDLQALQFNLQQIRTWVGARVQVLGVVKANAYGHGLLPIAEALLKSGVDGLGVAHVGEGVLLRQQGIEGKILVLGQILPEEAKSVVEYDLIAAAGNLESLSALNEQALQADRVVPVHLKIDTGMGRYGIWYEDALELAKHLETLSGLQWHGAFSHFSSAGQSIEKTQLQIQRFKEAVRLLELNAGFKGLRHLSNSVGLVRFQDAHWDMVRSGLLLYGISPIRHKPLPFELKPVLSLKSRIYSLKQLQVGQSVSYGGTFVAQRPTTVAAVPIGYAQGYPRGLSDKAYALVQGQRVPVVGRVTMEDLMLDVTEVPEAALGDPVVLIGRQGDASITASELARLAKTIPYEILAGLSAQIPRYTL